MEKLSTKKSFSDWFSDTRAPYRCEWIFYIAACALLVFTNSYSDVIITATQSVKFWPCLFSGKLLSFFEVTGAAYPFTMYLIFAAFNLPMYLISAIFGVEMVDQWWFIGYNKLWLVVALLLSVKLLERLGEAIGFSERESKWAAFIYFTSAYVMHSLVAIGQYDIFAIVFMLLALISLQKQDTKRFLLWFSIAITMKYFALIAFLPILLLTEKKVLQILKKLAVACVPLLLFARQGLIFRWGLSAGARAPSLEESMLARWFPHENISFGSISIYFFMVCYIALLAWCYSRKTAPGEHAIGRLAIYAASCAYALFFTLVDAYPYWYILLTPFVALIMFFNKSQLKLSLLLDIFASCSRILLFENAHYFWCTGFGAISKSLIGVLFGFTDTPAAEYADHWIRGACERLVSVNLWYFIRYTFGSVFFVGTVLLLIINRPRASALESNGEEAVVERSVIWARAACSIMLAILPVAVIIYKELYYRGAL